MTKKRFKNSWTKMNIIEKLFFSTWAGYYISRYVYGFRVIGMGPVVANYVLMVRYEIGSFTSLPVYIF
jgi:hypothetical protein